MYVFTSTVDLLKCVFILLGNLLLKIIHVMQAKYLV